MGYTKAGKSTDLFGKHDVKRNELRGDVLRPSAQTQAIAQKAGRLQDGKLVPNRGYDH